MADLQEEACLKLAKALSEQPSQNAQLLEFHSAAVSKLQRAGSGQPTPSDILDALRHLTMYFHATTDRNLPYNARLSMLLADVTREWPFWRPLFGLQARPSPETNLSQGAGEVDPDCILEVARRIVDRPRDPSRRNEEQAALRIIANCCADNNVSRNLIVHRGGVKSLMSMTSRLRTDDLTLPTLYNICIDYDEPAVDNEGKPLPPLNQMQPGTDQSSPTLNLAEQKLGMYYDSGQGQCSVTLLVKVRSNAGPHLSVLADLIEMASRVALYGTHNLLPNSAGEKHPERSETHHVHVKNLVRPLILEGSVISRKEPESCPSICQAVLNILSQPECRETVAGDPNLIWSLMNVPYLIRDGEDEDEELDETLAPYRKAILKIVYEISASGTYAAISGPGSSLLGLCMDYLHVSQRTAMDGERHVDLFHNGPLASVCVLMANSITSTDSAAQLATGTPIASCLATVVEYSSDPDVLLPTVDIATRLCLCRKGQDALHAAGLLHTVRRLLKPTSEADALGVDIQRATVTLVRLLIKSRPEYLRDLTLGAAETSDEDQTVMDQILSLFEKTNDTATKIEIGRLAIEMLRTYFSSTTKTQQNAQADTKLDRPVDEHNFLSMCSPSSTDNATSIADTMAYIITQSQAQSQSQAHDDPPAPVSATGSVQAEAEAWFGLGLLSTLSGAHPWITAALARNQHQLLTRLRQIIQKNSHKDVEALSSNGNTPEMPHDTSSGNRDPRYENVKVLVARMVTQTPVSDTHDASAVKDGLEAAAAELGVGSVVV